MTRAAREAVNRLLNTPALDMPLVTNFEWLHTATPEQTGPERMSVFYALPADWQTEAWAWARTQTEWDRNQ